MPMKRLLLLLWVLLTLPACAATPPEAPSDRLQVVAAVFPAYDFARAAAAGSGI